MGGLACGDSRYTRMLKSLARMQVLILDDWGITPSLLSNGATCWRSSMADTAAHRTYRCLDKNCQQFCR